MKLFHLEKVGLKNNSRIYAARKYTWGRCFLGTFLQELITQEDAFMRVEVVMNLDRCAGNIIEPFSSYLTL